MSYFLLANCQNCLHFYCFQETVFVCRFNRYCSCIFCPMLFKCRCRIVAVKAWKATCAPLLTSRHSNQTVLRIVSGRRLQCLYKLPPAGNENVYTACYASWFLYTLSDRKPKRICFWILKLNTTEMSQCCLTCVFNTLISHLNCPDVPKNERCCYLSPESLQTFDW